ncbi:Predicted oxidoreductase, contains short-chain dehydrogenase (SDR) and DUF2520 domains [Pseudarcicella hirudinis]|uniref:Predicted oxidoreductase, contains short-chain dehydrogenase (SDR) and DUF2520 domains n=1 Tax=Pseudarcicella hirudinis TaxID=1079859 RepID=A0A1I5Q7D3_9BACT|nr:Rossmann-like and DUF2520 domain-containing protein [Pseudarcicella hirudinis]SFP42268.1 Predicted oxidoreductase, contains short-chain dehydrogenase (SDR) and DUF2520 domains [Pseudarcicella hirudinis]
MKISFIGSGNVAWHLSWALDNAGHAVQEVYSRDIKNAKELARRLYNAKVQKDLNFAESLAEVFFLCVSDDAIEEVLQQLVLPENAKVIHTSGTKSLSVLDKYANVFSDVPVEIGVFYPLQTFSKSFSIDFSQIPICVEAENEIVENLLITLAQDISDVVYEVNSEERKVLHVGAVFACNFTNHLLGLAQEMLKDNDLDFKLLQPLIKETFKKALFSENIFEVQTGPARRGDQQIIQQHLQLLNNQPNLLEIYKVVTKSIMDKYRGDS